MHNFYEHMKPKAQKKYLEEAYFIILFNYLLSRFKWEGLPENIPQEFLEGYLISNGTCGLFKKGSDYWAIMGGYCGEIKSYLPSEYTGALAGVGSFNGKVGKDVAVCWNNMTRTPDLLLMKFANTFAELDISEKINIIFTRLMRIPKVKDQKEKEAIISSINAIVNGKYDAIISNNIYDISDLLDKGFTKDDNYLDLTDVNKIDKIQYLNQAMDNNWKNFWRLYGQRMQVSSKMAQLTEDELHSNDNVNMILTLQSLEMRERFCEEANKIFGLNLSVKLSECWEDNYEETVAMNNEGGENNENEEGQSSENNDEIKEQ